MLPRGLFDAEAVAVLANLSLVAGRGNRVKPEKFARFQYYLSLPGTVSGSYSKNLNRLWQLGGVVVLWSGAPHVEWYYPSLRRGKTHLELTKANALQEIAAVAANAARAARLLEGARTVSSEHLCPSCISTRHLAPHLRLPLGHSPRRHRTREARAPTADR